MNLQGSPSQYILVQSLLFQMCEVALVSIFLTLNSFHIFLWGFRS